MSQKYLEYFLTFLVARKTVPKLKIKLNKTKDSEGKSHAKCWRIVLKPVYFGSFSQQKINSKAVSRLELVCKTIPI